MKNLKEGGPAFPVSDLFGMEPASPDHAFRLASGMSLRDYFAAKAMQGLILNSQGTQGYDFALIQSTGAELAYEFADAMLKARAL